MKLVTGGSGLADGMAHAWTDLGDHVAKAESTYATVEGATVVISRSCLQITDAQVAEYKKKPAAGLLACAPLFWWLPNAIPGGAAAVAGIAIINSNTSLAGVVSPYMIGS